MGCIPEASVSNFGGGVTHAPEVELPIHHRPAMASYVGVDWAGSCWMVVKHGQTTTVTTEPSFLNVWHEHGQADQVKSILVDIPIGLPTSCPRACDERAAEVLAHRGNTVFSIPARHVVEARDYHRAREENGGSLGSQSWWLFPRIREVDVFLQECPQARQNVYESHPEVCFAKLTQSSLPAKDTEAGRKERLAAIQDDSQLRETIEEIVEDRKDGSEWHERISKGKLDDVIDAAVLAYVAKRLDLGPREQSRSYPRLPESPDEDPELGLPMEIVYCEP